MHTRGGDFESLVEASERNAEVNQENSNRDDAATSGENPEGAARTRGGLEKEAQTVASAMRLAARSSRSSILLERIPRLASQLEAAHRRFLAEAGHAWIGSYAGEWMLDNYHSVRQSLRQVKKDLPPTYYGELPKLAEPVEARGLPRIYEIVRAYVVHEQHQFNVDAFAEFLTAAEEAFVSAESQGDGGHRSSAYFTIGELWAAPIMLRIALLEGLAEAAQESLDVDLASRPELTEEEAPDVRAADTVAHCIQSLRRIDTEDWDVFFERVSRVHAILSTDPAGVYRFMDFATRDRYRSAVERIARRGDLDEVSVARAAIELATEATQLSRSRTREPAPEPGAAITLQFNLPRTCHVGYYLVDAGQRRLEEQARYRPTALERIERFVRGHATAVYLGSIGLFSLVILAAVMWYAVRVGPNGLAGWLTALGVALLVLIPASTMAVNLVNWLVTHTLAPQILPKLDFSKGIPASCRTAVVMPALVSHVSDLEFLVRQLELHYLRNPDPNLVFALLADLADAPERVMPEDEALIAATTEAIEALNRKYAGEPFYVFHRERRWNPVQGVWMGWERKRGNLHQFNQMLRLGVDQAGDGTYLVRVGRLERLESVRYVITLDADTVLPADAAHRLVGTLAHPLNRAEFDPESGRVVAGYTILQPRAEINPTVARHSLFTRIFAANTGIDLYTLAVSNVYQDLFGAGIYVGKGIYDVEAFERSLEGRIPENSLLSHDLFEGIHGRVGLVTDIVVFEDFPPHYVVNVLRSHRWVRGDWQLLPWLMPRTPRVIDGESQTVEFAPNDLALIDLWKIADNLRRSLFTPVLLLLFVLGWTILPGSHLAWTLIGLVISASNVMAALLSLPALLLRRADSAAWAGALRSLRYSSLRWLLVLAFLPHESLLSLDAIVRTLYRLYVSRKNLLEWTTAARAVRMFGDEVTQTVALRQMWPSVVMVAILALIIGALEANVFPLALPFLLIWLFSWEIAYRLSLRSVPSIAPLDEDERTRLRKLARRTWLFYEEFVGPRDNWLPPDHYQEFPRGVVAHYTSPTNIGMYIVSLLAAHDLGYIGPVDASVRLRFLFETLGRLERYRGHFLNWTNSESLTPLPPRYVSTVDSGNLAACLIVLKQSCLTIGSKPLWTWTWWQGLLDTVGLLEDVLLGGEFTSLEMQTVPDDASTDTVQSLREHLQAMRERILAVRETPQEWFPLLRELAGAGRQELQQRLLDVIEDRQVSVNAESLHTCRILVDRIRHHLDAQVRVVEMLQPWLGLGAELPQPLHSMNGTGPEPDGTDAVRAAWNDLAADLAPLMSLHEIASVAERSEPRLAELERLLGEAEESMGMTAVRQWVARLREQLAAAEAAARNLLDEFEEIARIADTYVREMDFSFLFDSGRQVFHIGHNVESGILDNSYYDLMASEARIASLIAIAKHDVPQSHWLHLGRPLTSVDGDEPTLLSWSGTMFEYLMPTLVARSYPETLLDQSVRGAIREQMAYGRRRGVPWGISESGFYAFDSARNYQYRAFGVPTLGFKRGLADDLVIAPYASLLALPMVPHDVLKNLDELERLGLLGRYGFYEAVDFTPSRLDFGARCGIVRSYMAHHQGMIMLALADALHGNRMVERFHREPMIQAVELLLQEQIPTGAPLQFPYREQSEAPGLRDAIAPSRSLDSWRAESDAELPQVHLLSNGRYSLILGATGGGFSRWNDLQLTRWRSDPTLEDHGVWIYVQELAEDGTPQALWSTTRQPMGAAPDHEEVIFHPHMVEFRRRDLAITSHTRVTVSVDEDVELRVVTLTNESEETRRLRIVSYGEVVLAAHIADLRHPAFVKLFVESEFLAGEHALLFRRRPRGANEAVYYLAHALVTRPELPGVTWGPFSYESDRMRFIGRDRDLRNPAALIEPGNGLSGTTGATLDPIFALGQEVELAPHATAELAFVTLAGTERRALRELLAQYRSWAEIEVAFARATIQAAHEARSLGMEGNTLEMFSRLLSLLLYPDGVRRAEPSVLAANRRGQSGLWPYGISGDYPILLVRIGDEGEGELLHQVLKAHTYWRRRNLKIDVVILNQQETNYGQEVRGFIMRMIQRTGSQNWLGQPGGLFVLAQDQLDEGGRVLLETAARVILDGDRGLLAEQLGDWFRYQGQLPDLFPVPVGIDPTLDSVAPPVARPDDLLFDNGIGGFSADGKEYVVYLPPEATGSESEPAPWINVVANPEFGFLVSASGSGYTWAVNSGENRLTTWRNDPVSNAPAEAIYLRDEETAEVWSPTAQPAPAPAPYLARHGAGYSTFEHNSHGLEQKLRLFVAMDAPVKIAQLRLRNLTPRPRRITVTYYAEWVLGSFRDETQMFIVPEYESELGALLARNSYSAEFSERVAFLAGSKETHSLTTDRMEFLGRCGSLRNPAGLARIGLSQRVEAGLDPCGVLQLHVDLAPGAETEVYFLIGQGANRKETIDLIRRFRQPEEVEAAWQAVQKFWDETLGAVTVETPDPAMNLLLNRWLLLQTLACRIWGRSALYQSGGAFGYRDQLQDVMALIHTRPDLTREHILNAARHQFEAGDVLHWWHPPSGRGLRTRISDNLLWLPYVTAHYIKATGDLSILEEKVPFLIGQPLTEGDEERYGLFEATRESYSIYEHCRRAIEKGATAGAHGIPLIGAGDWNDGMNRVGIEGRGESIWLGWFLYATLNEFADVCERSGDAERKQVAAELRERAERVRAAVEEHGWDGEWYRRAYDDEGVPLGSKENVECQIDAIAQSWSVLSGAGDPTRQRQAMASALKRLVKWDERLILLLTPPFDKSPRDPGYIKGYVPGIRENGGQYTHAAMWTILAFAKLGEDALPEQLFRLLNPIYRADSPEKAAHYRVEPYVISADVYGVAPHTGRGGWTWYTGSAGWMYRAGLEGILGLGREHRDGVAYLRIDPHIPADWPSFRVDYRVGASVYEIEVDNRAGSSAESGDVPSGRTVRVVMDGAEIPGGAIPLHDDGGRHAVRVTLRGSG